MKTLIAVTFVAAFGFAVSAQAMPRSPMSVPNTLGPGMPDRPFQPPVKPCHSAAPCSTTKPKAIATIARYGPRTFSAGIASSMPANPVMTPLRMKGGQNDHS